MERQRRTEGKKRIYRRQTLLGWLFSFAVAALVCAVLFGLWLTPVRIRGNTMAPALTEDQIVLVDRAARFVRLPRRGEMILFDDPRGTGRMIKRIVGLPGETVELVRGAVYINSCPLDESQYADLSVPAGDMAAVLVPEGALFVLGDNRAVAYDSRTGGVGCIPYTAVLGTVRIRISPKEALTYYE